MLGRLTQDVSDETHVGPSTSSDATRCVQMFIARARSWMGRQQTLGALVSFASHTTIHNRCSKVLYDASRCQANPSSASESHRVVEEAKVSPQSCNHERCDGERR